MDTLSKASLAVRNQSKPHKSNIANKSKTISAIADLIAEAYAEQNVVFTTPTEQDPRSRRISDYFYHHCFVSPRVKRGRSGEGNEVRIEELLAQCFFINKSQDSNHISFLLGDVGVGKTAFIKWLLTTHRARILKSDIWFVRLNVERVGDTKEFDAPTVLKALDEKARYILKHFDSVRGESSTSGDGIFGFGVGAGSGIRPGEAVLSAAPSHSGPENIIESLIALITQMRKVYKRRLLIIFDNIDWIAHLHDRDRFTEEGLIEETKTFSAVYAFISSFLHDNPTLGRLGANVLFVMRSDTYHTLCEIGRTSGTHPVFINNRNAYFLECPDWSSVLQKRNDLLRFAASLPSEVNVASTIDKFTHLLNSELYFADRDGVPLLQHLQRLTSYGLRAMIEFFAAYSWVPGPTNENRLKLLERFAANQPIALIAFMLGGLFRFGQMDSHFPNIYLVNSHTFAHEHTYWLKRLIFDYIGSLEKRGESVSTADVFALFACRGGYPRKLVSLCLGSMGSANGSNLIRPVRRAYDVGPSTEINTLELTTRGCHCRDVIFDRFCYLQLIIDDELLPIPKLLQPLFEVTQDTPDYAYLAESDDNEFHRASTRMVQYKAPRVLQFIETLEASLQLERQKYSAVFKMLDAQGISIVSPSDIYWSVWHEIYLVSSVLNCVVTEPNKQTFKDNVARLKSALAPLYA